MNTEPAAARSATRWPLIQTSVTIAMFLLVIGAAASIAVALSGWGDLCQETNSAFDGGCALIDWETDYKELQDALETLVVTEDTTLSRDISGNITINADNTTLDCEGHEVTGLTGAGIRIRAHNVTVKNCVVTGFDDGILLLGATESTIVDNTATGNRIGYRISGSRRNRFTGNIAKLNYEGIYLEASHANVLEDNTTIGGRSGMSVDLSNDNTLENNTVSGATTGIHLRRGSGNVVAGNTISVTLRYGGKAIKVDSPSVHENLFDANEVSRP